MVTVSSPSNLTMGWPPDSFSTRFWGRNRATTLMVFAPDIVVVVWMLGASGREWHQHERQAASRWRVLDGQLLLG